MTRKHLNKPFAVKSLQDNGTFTGYASVFDVVDSYGDVVKKGAFLESLSDWGEKGKFPPMLWQHNTAEPIGVFTKMVEDESGLYVEGRLLIEDDPLARRAYAHLKAGSVSGLSIGYTVPSGGAHWDEKAGAYRLEKIKLYETSLVTFPANEEAGVEDVKNTMPLPQEVKTASTKQDDRLADIEDKLIALEKKAGRPGQQFAVNTNNPDPQVMKGFGTFLKTGIDPNFDEFCSKSMETGNGASGGYAVPEDFDREIRKMLPAYAPLIEHIDYDTTTSKGHYEIVNLGGTTAQRNAEKSTRNATNTPKLARIDFKLTEMNAIPETTNEFRHTTQISGLQSWLTAEVAEAFADMMQAEVLHGTGTDEAEGIFTKQFDAKADKERDFGTWQQIQAASPATIEADELLSLIFKLAPKFRAKSSCRWYMNTATLEVVSKLKDSEGRYLFKTAENGVPGYLAGYPVVEVEGMDDIEAGKTPVMFGDLKRAYRWRELQNYDRMILDEVTKKGWTKFYRTKLSDGRVINTNALKFLKMAAA